MSADQPTYLEDYSFGKPWGPEDEIHWWQMILLALTGGLWFWGAR